MGERSLTPSPPTRRDLMIGGLCLTGALVGSSGSAWSAPQTLPEGGLDALVPRRLGEWRFAETTGVVVAQDWEAVRGPYDDLLTRNYQSTSSSPLTLLVAYSGSQQHEVRLHRPEGCYPAAGFRLSDRTLTSVRLTGLSPIAAQMVHAESASRTEEVLYWTRVGRAFPTNALEQSWAVARESLAGRGPDGILVRLSMVGADRNRARAEFDAFLDALLAGSTPTAARILFGQPARPAHGPSPPVGRNGDST